MTNSKNTQRALLSSVVALLLCFAMLLGTTFAYFTDSAVSGSNVITSGNLDLEVKYTLDGTTWNDLDGADDLFQQGLWEPGHTEVVALKVTNNGSLALKYSAKMNIVSETAGKTKDGADIVLSNILTVSTLVQQAGAIGDITLGLAFGGENSVAYESKAAFKSANVIRDGGQLLPGDEHYVIVKVDMAETVGNEANHDGVNAPAINFGINVVATQFTYESDSFGNQYDKDAFAADYYVTNADALAEAMQNAEKDDIVALMDDVEKTSTESNAYGKTGLSINNGQIFDGNGNTFGVPTATGTWDSAINITGGTIRNVTVNSGFRGIFINHNSTYSAPVILENVVIDGPVYTISCDQGTNQGLTATGCTFNGWTSYAATLGNTTFVDCSFGEGSGYAFCRPYAPTSFVNCNFEAGYEIDARAAVTLENCYLDGVLITADNVATLVTGNTQNAIVK